MGIGISGLSWKEFNELDISLQNEFKAFVKNEYNRNNIFDNIPEITKIILGNASEPCNIIVLSNMLELIHNIDWCNEENDKRIKEKYKLSKPNEPILEFTDLAHAYSVLKEWQDRLFLNDWIIKLELVDNLAQNDKILGGLNNLIVENKSAHIKILKCSDITNEILGTFCHEHVLIHELLHCKYNWLEIDYNQSIPAAYYDILEHALLEQMAKSLLMAKYGINFDWFKNF